MESQKKRAPKEKTMATNAAPKASQPEGESASTPVAENIEMKNKISLEEYQKLQEALAAQEAKTVENFDGWQRERADFSNYKKRIERDQILLEQSITGSIIKRILPVIDDMERALKVRPTDGEAGAWADGVELVYRKLQTILESEGVQRIEADHAEFDPQYHEAISHEDHPDVESGSVIEVVQTGYMIGERVLRPARVRVAR